MSDEPVATIPQPAPERTVEEKLDAMVIEHQKLSRKDSDNNRRIAQLEQTVENLKKDREDYEAIVRISELEADLKNAHVKIANTLPVLNVHRSEIERLSAAKDAANSRVLATQREFQELLTGPREVLMATRKRLLEEAKRQESEKMPMDAGE